VIKRITPRGMNAMPMAKNAGRTVPAVRIGCQAGSLCCLSFVSEKKLACLNRYISLLNSGTGKAISAGI